MAALQLSTIMSNYNFIQTYVRPGLLGLKVLREGYFDGGYLKMLNAGPLKKSNDTQFWKED